MVSCYLYYSRFLLALTAHLLPFAFQNTCPALTVKICEELSH